MDELILGKEVGVISWVDGLWDPVYFVGNGNTSSEFGIILDVINSVS